jgi:hypothetical protein
MNTTHLTALATLVLSSTAERCRLFDDGRQDDGGGGRDDGCETSTGSAGGAGGSGGCEPPPNLVLNPSFEDGVYDPGGSPDGWSYIEFDASGISGWVEDEAHNGSRSVTIEAPLPNDASWFQSVSVQPETLYFLSGWAKTEAVAHSAQSVDAGANFSILGGFTVSPGVFGTQDWTRTGVLFNSGPTSQVDIAARIGMYSGTTTGKAWFDDVAVSPIVAVEPHPSWKILALIYDQTDFSYIDQNGDPHHYVAQMSAQEVAAATDVVSIFVEQDIPELTSGEMVPTLTVRYPTAPLSSLTPFGTAWWPAPEDVAAERDPAFDAVMVIWDPRAMDLVTGLPETLNNAAGLTPAMGTGQTYTAIIFDAVVNYGHRNVLKHEFGHSITEFFDAAGTAPKPKVENHAVEGQYVHCGTGDAYVWLDESDANPIPNSIYNNVSGFAHDYYSGTTALAGDPSTCLGITPDAWAHGGPVSHSGNLVCEDRR